MPFWPPKRRSPRAEGYDYSTAGAYFVTVCIQKREYLLGRVSEGILQLNDAGKMVERWWLKLESKFPFIQIDPFHVVMPNHFHGIVFLGASEGAHMGAPLQKIVQWFKSMSTNEYIHGVKEYDWPPFKEKLWQRSFYDHVIRDEESLNRIRDYIATNPQRWHLDRENPQAKGKDDFDGWLDAFKTRPPSSSWRGGPMCPPFDTRRQLGDRGEDLAARALKKQGYKILERNYATPLGEIDLIARHRGALVFIEVKTRRTARFGEPQDGVSFTKQARLRKLAGYYLQRQRLGEVEVRFDVVGITMGDDQPRVEIIQGAF